MAEAVIAISDPLALEAQAADLGPTAAYSSADFAHFPVRFDLAGFEDTAVDTTGDGVFDELRVTGSADVDSAGSYAINAQLRGSDGTQVAEFQTVASLVSGPNSFTLTFDGEQIAAAGLDGPFAVEDLSVYSLTDPNAVGYLVTAHTTAAYTAAQFGAGGNWSPSVRVNDDTGAQTQQERPSVVIGPDGAAYAIWDDMRIGNQTDVFFSRRDPATGSWSANQKVNDDATTRAQWRADIAVDGANNAYAVWQDSREGNQSGDANIYFSKRSATTGTWGPNLRVNDDKRRDVQTSPQIAVSAAGDAVAVWVDRRSGQWNIYSSRLPAGSSTWGQNLRVSDNTSSRKDPPDVAVASDGTVYAVWGDDRSGNWDIYWSKLLPGSSTWAANTRLSDDPGTYAQYSPSIGTDSTGNILAVWLDDRAPNTEVRSRRLPAGSGTWEPSQVASDAAAYLPSDLGLGVAPSGDALAVWADGRGTSWDIWGATYNPASQQWSVSRLISDDPGDSHQFRPVAAVRGSTEIAVWFDARESYLGDIRSSTR